MSDWVFVEQEPITGKEHPAQPGATIGRAGCDIEIQDPALSRTHARVRQLDANLAIEDLGSKNGTFVNGERIAGVHGLSDGDAVKFGNTVWKLRAGGAVEVDGTQPHS